MFYLFLCAALCIPLHTLAMEHNPTNKNTPINVKTFLEEQPCNKKNARGNTFLYQLAKDCSTFNYWEEARPLIVDYMNTHKGYSPNPFIEHEKIINNTTMDTTAKEEAILQLKNTGNPICGILRDFLDQAEVIFLDRSGSKKSREQMITGIVPEQQENT